MFWLVLIIIMSILALIVRRGWMFGLVFGLSLVMLGMMFVDMTAKP